MKNRFKKKQRIKTLKLYKFKIDNILIILINYIIINILL